MVPKCIGYFPEYRGVTGTPRGINGPQWALVEKREVRPEVAPPCPVRIGQGEGAAPPSFLLFSPLSLLLLLGLGKGGTESYLD